VARQRHARGVRQQLGENKRKISQRISALQQQRRRQRNQYQQLAAAYENSGVMASAAAMAALS